ncbi:hypothetical protein GCM10023347_18700 [Streptomyces chumphonensis]
MPVHGAGGDAGAGCDGGHRAAAVPLLTQESDGRCEDVGPLGVQAGLDGGRTAVRHVKK